MWYMGSQRSVPRTAGIQGSGSGHRRSTTQRAETNKAWNQAEAKLWHTGGQGHRRLDSKGAKAEAPTLKDRARTQTAYSRQASQHAMRACKDVQR